MLNRYEHDLIIDSINGHYPCVYLEYWAKSGVENEVSVNYPLAIVVAGKARFGCRRGWRGHRLRLGARIGLFWSIQVDQ